jgi:hypothetical protein
MERKRRGLGKAEEVLGRLTIKWIRRRWLGVVDRRVQNLSHARAEEEEIGGDRWACRSLGCLGLAARKRSVWQVVEAHTSVEAKKWLAGSDDDDQQLLTDSISSHASAPRGPLRLLHARIPSCVVWSSGAARWMAGHHRGGLPRQARPSAAVLEEGAWWCFLGRDSWAMQKQKERDKEGCGVHQLASTNNYLVHYPYLFRSKRHYY